MVSSGSQLHNQKAEKQNVSNTGLELYDVCDMQILQTFIALS